MGQVCGRQLLAFIIADLCSKNNRNHYPGYRSHHSQIYLISISAGVTRNLSRNIFACGKIKNCVFQENRVYSCIVEDKGIKVF